MIPDISHYQVLPQGFSGADPKIFLTHQHQNYMLKLPRTKPKFIPSHLSEHVACAIASQLGYAVQDTALVTYHNQEGVLVTLFEQDLVTFTGLGVSTLTHHNLQYDLDLLMTNMSDTKFGFDLSAYIWETFLLDSLILNLDRHPNNWGFFKGETYQPAPLFDLGNSLYSINYTTLHKMDDLPTYIARFSNSAIKYQGAKHSFREIIEHEKDRTLRAYLPQFINKLSGLDISHTLQEVLSLSPQHQAYCTFLTRLLEVQKQWYQNL